MKTSVTWLLIICLVPFLTGCEGLTDYTLTGRLWDSETGPFRYAPAIPSNLKLYQDQRHADVLVQYDELNDENGTITRRAYLLDANQKRLRAFKKPYFISIKTDSGLDPIPIQTNSAPVADSTNNFAPWAMISADGREFTLYSNGEGIGPCRLPVYGGAGANHFDRVMLTPVTVVGDVVIYTTVAVVVVGVAFGILWLYSNSQNPQ